MILVAVLAFLFALFPLTDTDIWWHLACGREWVATWTPVREPVVNVHEFFQDAVWFLYGIGGAPLLVVFKAAMYSLVFALFLRPFREKSAEIGPASWQNGPVRVLLSTAFLFLFRFQLELRPVVFSMLFLGIFWNVLPSLFGRILEKRDSLRAVIEALVVIALQWIWCRCQGLFILGPVFAAGVLGIALLELFGKASAKVRPSAVALASLLVILLFAMPLLHRQGALLFLYPFGLLDRMLGLSESATLFASQIAENRSPLTLLLEGENVLASLCMILVAAASVVVSLVLACGWIRRTGRPADVNGGVASGGRHVALWALYTFVSAVLALVAERNFILLMPAVLCAFRFDFVCNPSRKRAVNVAFVVLAAFVLGFWLRSLAPYERSFVSEERVPVAAARWMSEHPHPGRLFNDDRAGGYLAFVNPADSTYIDGRFILRTSDFFARYLDYAENPGRFMADARAENIDRALFPLRFYARWNRLLEALAGSPEWGAVYHDDFFIVFDRK